ncbi:P2Y purinoceptor 4-like [Paramacrobiotus metropolitanus]|uniref:P2Y purinoceptor 4-like n=1 Tax=Paramacrobiotus metropolitanus TaxID=2943436 RepID=UPI002445F23B|nr:P2Y purinoceptor 4-like [Paramacrobiotus metropolitanus]
MPNTTNITIRPYLVASNWDTLQSWTAGFCTAAILANAFLLYILIAKIRPWTPFTIYVVLLTIANILNGILQNPASLLIKDALPFPLIRPFCIVHLFLRIPIGLLLPIGHMLICVNRIFAIVTPILYKRYHTKKLAYWISGLLILAAVFITVPGVLMDAQLYRTAMADNRCSMMFASSLMQLWSTVYGALFYNVPVMVITLSYPLFIWKKFCQRKRNVRPTEYNSRSVVSTNKATSTSAVKTRKASGRSFAILTVMTVSVTVCWTPSNVYFWIHSQDFYFFAVVNLLKLLQSAIDPLLFLATMVELRIASAQILLLGRRKA